MNIYYIYAYINRKTGLPYYVGKGSGGRAWKQHGRWVQIPKDKSKIVIMESGLTEIVALALERRYISWFGRQDNGTGILLNMTDGGDGTSGMKFSEESRRKIGAKSKGRIPSAESRKKMSLSQKTSYLKGRTSWNTGRPAHNKGIPMSEEQKRKISETKRRKFFEHPENFKKFSSLRGKAIKGLICVTNGGHRTRIRPEKLQEYISKGYRKGFTLHTCDNES